MASQPTSDRSTAGKAAPHDAALPPAAIDVAAEALEPDEADSGSTIGSVEHLVDHLFRRESARMTAALVRVFGVAHIDLVEDVVQDALIAALRHWRYRGVPDNPVAWLTQVAKRRAIDRLRHDSLLRAKAAEVSAWAERVGRSDDAAWTCHDDDAALDEQLQLMFACCHPQLPREARIALTLRMVGGFNVPEIARAFLAAPDTIAQRLVRAKRRIREESIPLEAPEGDALQQRLEEVLEVLYLMFNEGYAAHSGDDLIRSDVIEEACRLVSLLLQNERTAQPVVHALMSLMLLLASRLHTRTDADGAVLLINEQDRSQWDQALIQRGFRHLQQAAAGQRLSRYHLEAAIAACHARAQHFEETDWEEILSLYDLLRAVAPSPVVELNRAVALAMARSIREGLAAMEEIAADQRLAGYYLLHAARGELLGRCGQHAAAADAFRNAIAMVPTEPERALLKRRLATQEARSNTS